MKLLDYGRLGGILIASGLGCAPAMAAASSADSSMLVYIGTYTGARSQGIYLAHFEAETGRLGPPELAVRAANPSFLVIDSSHQFLHAVSETGNFGGKRVGAVSAFRIEAQTGKLRLIAERSSGGAGPCHLALDRTGKWLLTANYGSGAIALLPVAADGTPGDPAVTIQHRGSSINPRRQEGPHAHFITTDPANRFVLACDLGLDKVLVYRFDPAQGSLAPNDPPSAGLRPGAGPRHLAFHPNGRLVFVISEMGSSLTSFAYDGSAGTLKEIQTVSTLPPGFSGDSTCAEVQVHPSGRFVYGSNRGDDSIAVFAVAPGTGRLSLVAHQSTQGKTPRHFAIDPSGRWLLAENQDSDSVVVFRLDADTGRLTPTGQAIKVGSPVCVAFVAPWQPP